MKDLSKFCARKLFCRYSVFKWCYDHVYWNEVQSIFLGQKQIFFFWWHTALCIVLALDEESKALCCWNKLVKIKEKLLSDFLIFSSCPSAAHIPYVQMRERRAAVGWQAEESASREESGPGSAPALPLTLWPWPSGALKLVLTCEMRTLG